MPFTRGLSEKELYNRLPREFWLKAEKICLKMWFLSIMQIIITEAQTDEANSDFVFSVGSLSSTFLSLVVRKIGENVLLFFGNSSEPLRDRQKC